MLKLDNETIKLMKAFKLIQDKQSVADALAEHTVRLGLERKSPVLKHYYGADEPEYITVACISFGLLNLMEEDFYIVKEVLSYEIVFSFLNEKKKYIEVVNSAL